MKEEERKGILNIIREYKDEEGGLIPILQKIQEILNFLPEEAIFIVSEEMRIPISKVYGVITFYASFSLKPRGKYVLKACCGTACHVKGQGEILNRIKRLLNINEGETSGDFVWTLERVACVGACSLAPVIIVNNAYYGKMNLHKTEMIINHYRAIEKVEGL